jgi:hypothetical protein
VSKSCFPAYSRILEEEKRDRASIFCGKNELVAGVSVLPMTPLILETLVAFENPLLVGGEITRGSVLHFLWIVSDGFSTAEAAREAFLKEWAIRIDKDSAAFEINFYIERTFMDSASGKLSKPYFSMAAFLIHQMAKNPFRWSMEKTMQTPLRIIFQLLKASAQEDGEIVFNKRSDKALGDAAAELNRAREAKEISEEDLIRLRGGLN